MNRDVSVDNAYNCEFLRIRANSTHGTPKCLLTRYIDHNKYSHYAVIILIAVSTEAHLYLPLINTNLYRITLYQERFHKNTGKPDDVVKRNNWIIFLAVILIGDDLKYRLTSTCLSALPLSGLWFQITLDSLSNDNV